MPWEIQDEIFVKLFLIVLWNEHYGQIMNLMLDDDA